LAGKFSYLDLVLQDTPIGDDSVFAVLDELLRTGEVESKFKRVRTFLDYLKVEEEREFYVVMSTSESLALRRSMIPRMIAEFQEDEAYIRRRIVKRRKDYQGESTPYTIEKEVLE